VPVSLPDLAATLLDERVRKLLTTGEEIEALDATGLHGLRLRAKRARYATEIFATLYPPRPALRFVERLGALQDRLGVMNDRATAAALLAQLGPKHSFAAGLVLGFIGSGTTKLRPRIMKAWDKFRKTPGFWE
jgi:CHAD domain-containing protein